MQAPQIEVLGVYKLDVTDDIFRKQLPLYGEEGKCRDHFSSVVLIEVLVQDVDHRFEVGHFTQPSPNYPHNSPQVAYDEARLSIDGETLISGKSSCADGESPGPVRVAFYLHYYDASLPLKWTYGEVACPTPSQTPVRLEVLVPYRPCD